ncbi:MAG: hypothetical protein CMG17_07725 [Candidatus Marinimicrobia bacterium]|jgi:hypothetical protein|nr:hypothetical protein [Candidatus Neomarinimicrobiota bacterium]MAR96219.1 hypothetical protein [Candidatus Neomarinimicrobiota bacterium]MAR97516.1 hypothetical protein [Candidatus Neomarinimicrobiota bacterium]|tara:strand:- start:145 stop:402 length:258 start_codon:yes stop_codon:yes gene_type:complete
MALSIQLPMTCNFWLDELLIAYTRFEFEILSVCEAPAARGNPLLVVTEEEFPKNIEAELFASARIVNESAGADDCKAAAVVPTVA